MMYRDSWAIAATLALAICPASAGAQTEEEDAFVQPVLAIGAFGLGAVDVACLTPAVITIVAVADGDAPEAGPILVNYICAAAQISAGLAYALRDGPGWQQTIGVVTTGLGAVSLGAAIAGSFAPSVEVAGARVRAAPWTAWVRPDEPVWGLSLTIR